MPFLRILRARLAIILSAFVSNNRPEPIIFLFPRRTQFFPIDAWSIFALGVEQLAIARACRVLKIAYYKGRDGKNDEHLRFQVELSSTNGHSRRGWILVQHINIDTCNPSSSFDRVFIPKGGDQTEIKSLDVAVRPTCTLTMPSDTAFSAADLAALLPLVTEYETEYNSLAPTQCNCFAYAVYKCIQYMYPGCIEILGRPAFGWCRKCLKMETPCVPSAHDIQRIMGEWSKNQKIVSEKQTLQEMMARIEALQAAEDAQLRAIGARTQRLQESVATLPIGAPA